MSPAAPVLRERGPALGWSCVRRRAVGPVVGAIGIRALLGGQPLCVRAGCPSAVRALLRALVRRGRAVPLPARCDVEVARRLAAHRGGLPRARRAPGPPAPPSAARSLASEVRRAAGCPRARTLSASAVRRARSYGVADLCGSGGQHDFSAPIVSAGALDCLCGRGDRSRTCDIRFWRPALWPSELHPFADASMSAGRVSHHRLSRRPRPSAGPLRVPVASAPMRSAPPPRAGAVPPHWPYVRRTPWPRSLYDRAAPCAAAAPLPRVRPGAVRALLRRRTAASRVHRSSSAAVPPCAGVAPCSPAAAPPGCAVLASAQVEVDAFAGSARSGWSAHRRDAAPAGVVVRSLSPPPRGRVAPPLSRPLPATASADVRSAPLPASSHTF